GPVVARAEVLDPLCRVREAAAAVTWPASLNKEDRGVGIDQTPGDHATRRTCADDHVVVISGEQADVAGTGPPRGFCAGHGCSLSLSESSPAVYATRLRGDPSTNASIF